MSFGNVRRMPRPVPPLNPLLVFVAAARAGSFSGASEELGVTQSAVSRQVAVLEGFLGCALFLRTRDGARLTPAGEAYFRAVGPAFEAITTATERLLRARAAETQRLRLRVYTTFAALWLIPRLNRFKERHPKIEVRLSNSVAPVDFARDEADLAIQFGDGNWPGLHARLLLPDRIQPVCAPSLLKGTRVRRPADLKGQRLLHARYRRDDWPDWLRAFGPADLAADAMEFPSSVLAYQAAKEGMGIAMGQVHLLGQDLAAGTLVALCEPLERQLGYYILWPKRRDPRRAGRAFIAWLEQELATAPAA